MIYTFSTVGHTRREGGEGGARVVVLDLRAGVASGLSSAG